MCTTESTEEMPEIEDEVADEEEFMEESFVKLESAIEPIIKNYDHQDGYQSSVAFEELRNQLEPKYQRYAKWRI